MTFSTEQDNFGQIETIDLIEDGRNISVTEENKAEYVEYFYWSLSLITQWKVHKRVEIQSESFKTGFFEVIPRELLNVFDERELELLIGGIAEIDVNDWKKHTEYRGYNENDELIRWFWKVFLI